MDIQSFIQSGLLESFSLGHCSAEEQVLVEQMLAQHPEARAELEAIEKALEQYANAQSVPPPQGLKDRIMQEIDRSAIPASPPANNTMLRLFQVLAIGLLAATGYLLFQKNQSDANRETLQNQVAQLQLQLIDCDDRNAACRQIIELIRNPETRAFKMSNAKDGPSFVFHNTSSSRCTALVDVAALPRQPDGKYLQFWALVDGKPVNMGMIRQDTASGFQSFDCVENAGGFAVSIEDNENGNEQPTFVLMAGTAG
ncbi:MAG: anti-sigma factor [Lewinellaceae bacterium]|nr:anti-sigma factor [Lewinellaceae bacterium]